MKQNVTHRPMTRGQKQAIKQRRWLAKQKRIQEKLDTNTLTLNKRNENFKARQNYSAARRESNAQRGGPVGWWARRQLKNIAANEAKIAEIKLKPVLKEKAAKTEIETAAAVKQTKSKGAAIAGSVSALGTSYAVAKEADSKKDIARAEADKAIADALSDSTNNTPNVDSVYKQPSATGLREGVR